MADKKVKLKDQLGRVVRLDDGNGGATLGKNLYGPDGKLLTAAQIINPTASQPRVSATVWKLIREIPANIQKIAALVGKGFAVRNGNGDWALRTLQEGTGIDITNADGDAGNPVIGLEDAGNTGLGDLLAITVDAKGRVVGRRSATTTDLAEGTNLYFTNARADARINLQKGQPNGIAPLGPDSLIPTAYLPPLALTDVSVVNSQAAQLALVAQEGDVAVRTDISKNYIHNGGTSGTMADWTELLTPAAPVQSVNGKTGTVVLVPADIGAATAAQGAKADSAVQSVGVGTGMSSNITDPRNPILSLAANLQILSAGTWKPEVLGKDFNLAGTDATEISLGVKNDGGGTAVFHYYTKLPSGLPPLGAILGGAGSRPWDGSNWAAHSTAAYHLVASENHTPTATGTNFRTVATPVGKTQADRIINTDFNGDGDIINSLGLTLRKINPTERTRGLEIVRTNNACEISMVSDLSSSTYQTLFRGYSVGGTISSPMATPGNRGTGYALCGHDGSNYVGAKALVSLLTFADWSATSTPTTIALETTATGSTVRTARWFVKDTGHFYPGADNAYDMGTPTFRARQYYGVNTSISTSDATLKTDPRDMTDAEVAAFLEIGRLPMVWQWLARIEDEGESARLHSGPTVQAAIGVMESHGLQWSSYAAFCYDEWEDIPEVINEDGDVSAAAVPAGSRYSFRKEELIWWVMRAFIARQDAMQERLDAL